MFDQLYQAETPFILKIQNANDNAFDNDAVPTASLSRFRKNLFAGVELTLAEVVPKRLKVNKGRINHSKKISFPLTQPLTFLVINFFFFLCSVKVRQPSSSGSFAGSKVTNSF